MINKKGVEAYHLMVAEKYEAALLIYRSLLAEGYDHPSIHGNMSVALNKVGLNDEALTHAEKAIQSAPDKWEYKLNKSTCLMRLERLEEGESLIDEVIAAGTINLEIILNKARFIYLRNDYRESIHYCVKGLRLESKEPRLICCLADNYLALGRYKWGMKAFEEAAKIAPIEPQTGWHRSLALLKTGAFADGWQEYKKWGFGKTYPGRNPYRYRPENEWTGQEIGGHLTVWGEQGVGDELMFSKFIKYIPNSFGRVDFIVDPRMVPVFSKRYNLRPNLRIGAYHEFDPALHIPLGNLPVLYWDAYLNDPEHRKGYLIRDKFESTTTRIGITWRGGRTGRHIAKRSIPLGVFRRIPVLQQKNIQIVVLQYNTTREETLFLQAVFGDRVAFPKYDPMKDLNSWVDHIDSCDFLVSIDNSALHFAGALEIPSLALLPKIAEFRWGIDESENNWYQSLTLLRGIDRMSIEHIADAIEHWLSGKLEAN